MPQKLLGVLVVALLGSSGTQAVAQNIVQYTPEPLLMNASDLVPV
ncbi:hypothetical protein FHY18_003569 [Xanthomonas arboricola]|nr:hypothetical protein [Xanthomonas sp. 3793]MCS3747941.1 hypothetical protein [Xanthomonas sp. 3793]